MLLRKLPFLMIMSNQFIFQFERTLQAAALLLKYANEVGHKITIIHLLKMLYIADREYLAENGYPLTGDKVAAMQYGPVLSHTFDLIRGKDSASYRWGRYIQKVGNSHVLRLINDPGIDELSRLAEKKIASVFNRFGKLRPFEVVRLTHEFPEWQKNYQVDTSTWISWQDILLAQDKSDMVDNAGKQIKLQLHMERLQEALYVSR
ncbi:hypothetical protein FACS1894214_0160 [Planctomycetales bacterium]|nr:hypothetical protein FACS1894214_0160 [Planctomycetales bacterium]